MIVIHKPEELAFVAFDGEENRMGEIVYAPDGGNRLAATHTKVDAAFQGRGVAGALLDALSAHARAGGLKIIPVCSYVEAAFARNPEKYRDVAAN